MREPGPYVVTFAVSLERMPLAVPFLHELEHFSAFRSQTIERGQSVFRHHVGYFETPEAARAALHVVRRHYTDAHIATAPNRGLGSLDDTGITEFSVARPAAARHATPSAPAGAGRRAAAARDGALQRYAIQLDALRRADAPARAPDLGLLHAHTLYRIHVLLEGVRHQAFRLGFFPSMDAVQPVLAHVRNLCPSAIVVPVSAREYARVCDLAPGQGPDGAASRPGGGRTLSDRRPDATEARSGSRAGAAGRHEALPSGDLSCEFGAQELASAGRTALHRPPLR